MFGLTSGGSDYLIIRLIIRMPEISRDSSSSPSRILIPPNSRTAIKPWSTVVRTERITVPNNAMSKRLADSKSWKVFPKSLFERLYVITSGNS